MLLGHMDPKRLCDAIHLEVINAARLPKTRIFTIETRKRDLRQVAHAGGRGRLNDNGGIRRAEGRLGRKTH